MLGSLKPIVLGLLLAAGPAFAATTAQCKAGCKSELKPACEKACRDHAKNIVDKCIKEMCAMAMERCDKMCEDTPPKGGGK
ncbi:MAG: hypothetical protein H6Q89_567 [Myxococcaceae bacterium]|nr:hypothetical protein [Myxococcaceae bacterium]